VFDKEFYEQDRGRNARALKRAVKTWNRWAKAKGKVAFVVADKGMEIPELGDCSQASYTGALTNSVGVWKISGHGWHSNRRASCGTNADGSPGKLLSYGVPAQVDWRMDGRRILGASVLLNFEDYNAPGKQEIDVESLMLHQLGHVLGLLHSCNGSHSDHIDSTTAPLCVADGKLTAPQEYVDAVMFPWLGMDQTKRDLGANDFHRVNCLY
jgi:hypothetical protein